jgi:hypothetical protein
MTRHKNSLDLLNWDQAARLVQARLDSQPELARLRAGRPGEPLWPLRAGNLKAALGPRTCTARKVLSAAARLFQGGVPDRGVEPFLEQTWDQRLEAARARVGVEQSDAILEHGLPLLVDLAGKEWKQVEDAPLRDVDLVLESPDGRVGVSLCNQKHMTSLAGRLRRLGEQLQGKKKLQKLVLLRDARLAVSAKAAKTHAYLDRLTQQDGRLVRPTVEVLAALEALRALLSDAKSGDLAHDGETVEPATVRRWLADHLPPVLRRFLDEVVSFPTLPDEWAKDAKLFDDLTELLDARYLLPLEEAAAALKRPAAEVATCARQHAEQFGWLNGPPAVLFQRAPTGAEN